MPLVRPHVSCANDQGRVSVVGVCVLQRLFFAVLFGVSLRRFISVSSGVRRMAPRCMRMVRGLLVMSGIVILSRLSVVTSGMR